MANETNTYVAIFQALTNIPHGQRQESFPVHQASLNQTPRFYPHLAAWHFKYGRIRDHNVSFAAALCLADYEQERNVGLALLREMNPRQVVQVLQLIDSTKNQVSDGRFYNVPRSVRTEIARYLREREATPVWWDKAVLSAREAMKQLYISLHIAPDARAQLYLFDDDPQDGVLSVIKMLPTMSDPLTQAKVIVDWEIPWPIATSVVKTITPEIMIALVNSMTPAQVLSNMKSLKTIGALDNPDLKAMIQSKIKKSGKDKRVTSGRMEVAVREGGLDQEFTEIVRDAEDQNIKGGLRITKPTGICIDISGSQRETIEFGKLLLSTIVPAMGDETASYQYAFNDVGDEIKINERTVRGVEMAMRGVEPNGMTAYGIPIRAMKTRKQIVEQIVFIGDEGENKPPAFENEIREYITQTGVTPAIIMVRIGNVSETVIENVCRKLKIEFHAITYDGDEYTLQQVANLLSAPSLADLVMKIMDFPLPIRRVS